MADVLRQHKTVGGTSVDFDLVTDASTLSTGPTGHHDVRRGRAIKRVAVLHTKAATAGDNVYFTVNGTTPTAKGDNTYVGIVGVPVYAAVSDTTPNAVTVKVIGSASGQEVSVWVA